jgi:RHS repeat-associated protein
LHVYSDDGWILGVGRSGGAQPSYVRGDRVNAPSVTPLRGFKVLGADNQPSSPTLSTVTVHFPQPGVYPVELDYTECCGGDLTFVLGTDTTTPTPAVKPVPVRPAQTFGSANASTNSPKQCAGDPVDCATGNFTETATDLMVPGRGLGLAWQRSYNAQDNDPTTASLLGVGWSAAYGMHLDQDPDSGMVTVVQENGARVDFAPTDTGYETDPSVLATLVHHDDGTFTFTRRARTLITFSPTGKLLILADLNGNTTHFAYDSAGQLTSATDPAGQALTVTTDSVGRVVTVADPLGRTVHYGYDGNSDLVSVTDPAGGATSYSYDSAHRVTAVTDPVGSVTRNTYDDTGRVIAQTDPNGGVTTFAYTVPTDGSPDGSDVTGSATTTITDPTGLVTQTVFEDYLPVSHTVGVGTTSPATWTYTNDPTTLGLSSVTDPLGRTSLCSYDEHGNLTSLTSPAGARSAFSYDSLDDVLSQTDPLGVTTTSTYDAAGNVTGSTWPVTSGTASMSLAYGDAAHPGDVTGVTDPNGHTSHLTYTPSGQVASVTSPLGRLTRYSYDAAGQQLTTTAPSGAVTASRYDLLGDVISSTDALGHVSLAQYDPAGRQIAVLDASGHLTRTVYDAIGQPVATVRPDGSSLHNSFDAAGRLITQTDPAGRQTSYGYDGLGQLVSTTLPTGATTRYAYDVAGQLTSSTDTLGRVTTSAYTPDGLLSSLAYSDGHTANVSYTYDALGQRTTMTDGTGTSSYAYTPSGQLAQMTNGRGQHLAYSYDPAGQATSLTYPDGRVVHRSYDADGQVTTVNDGRGGAFGYTYSPDGQITSTLAPNRVSTRYGYDVLDQLSSISITRAHQSLLHLSYQRTATGLLAGQTGTGSRGQGQAVGTAQRYGYDLLDQLTRTSSLGDGAGTSDGAGSGPSGLRYGYDPTGNLLSVAGPGAHRSTLTYTPTGQLAGLTITTGQHAQAKATFGFDVLGERTSTHLANASDGHKQHGGTETLSYAYDQAGRLTRYTGPEGGLGLSVEDPTSPQSGNTEHAATVNAPSVSASYSYDGDGIRTGKTLNGTSTSFLYDPTAAIPTLLTSTAPAPSSPQHGKSSTASGTSDCPKGKDGHGAKASDRQDKPAPSDGKPGHEQSEPTCTTPAPAAVVTDVIYGPDGSPIEQATASKPALYVHADQLGSTRLLTDASGKAIARYSYTPYGTLRASKDRQGQPVTALLFGGSYHDSESGLYYLQARYYDPATTQFLTRDPLEAITGQPYAYAAGSPLNSTDPTGLMVDRERGVSARATANRQVASGLNRNGSCGQSATILPGQPGFVGPVYVPSTTGAARHRNWHDDLTAQSTVDLGVQSGLSQAVQGLRRTGTTVPRIGASSVGGAASGLIQLVADSQNRSLSGGQRARRAGLATGTSVLAGYGAELTVGAGGLAACPETFAVGCVVAAAAGLGIVAGVGYHYASHYISSFQSGFGLW